MQIKKRIIGIAAVAVLFAACSAFFVKCPKQDEKKAETGTTTLKLKVPYSADSAYRYIEEQVAFGPRVSGTEANRRCGDYIIEKLRSFGADSIIEQHTVATAFNGDRLPLRNIMGRFNSDRSKNRILLVAHYDTRPWADRDKNSSRTKDPIDGANDGGSGVATLLALALQFKQERPDIAVDMLFVDGEDYGDNSGWENNDTSWCLGTQHWVKNMPADYAERLPRYGILLDMVGARNARFYREYFSHNNCPEVVDKIWSFGAQTGHYRFFVNELGASVIDDHVFITRAGIPTADIIDIGNKETGSFPPTWHTHNDTIGGISRATLRYVGQTVSNVIYYERI